MATKLDLKDKKILFELDFDARIPYSHLARKVGLSKQGIEYKINNLIKKGVIKGFYPVVNTPKLGYLYCRLILTMQNLTEGQETEIMKFLRNHKKVFWLFSLQGTFDIGLAIWAKSVQEFKEFTNEIETKFGSYIKRKVESIMTDVIHYQNRYLLERVETKEIHIKETQERAEIDELDKKILTALCDNGRMSLVKIAAQVNQSAKVVAYRIKRLEKKKLIEGYRPIIDHKKIGCTHLKIFIALNNLTKEKLLKLKRYIKDNPLVIYIVEGIGLPADLDIEMVIQSNEQLFEFIRDLKFKFPTLIGEYNSFVVLDTIKVRYLPF